MVAPGLAFLRELHPSESITTLKQRLRIGEVYFAALDTALQPFIKRFLKFKDIVERTTVNINRNDSVLSLSAFSNGISRLGKPDINALTEEETELVIELLATPQFNVLDVGDSEALDIGKSHDSWYSHPWVSTDLLLLLLTSASPEERGLVPEYNEAGVKLYYFPDNYEQNIHQLLKIQRDKLLQEYLNELGQE